MACLSDRTVKTGAGRGTELDVVLIRGGERNGQRAGDRVIRVGAVVDRGNGSRGWRAVGPSGNVVR